MSRGTARRNGLYAEPTRTQRERLLEGMTQTVQRRGYSDTTIGHVVAVAGVSRTAFYAHFDNKEDCFLAAYQELAARVSGELRLQVAEAQWASKAHTMLSYVLDPALDEPVAAWRLLLSQARGAGPAIRAERERLIAEIEREIESMLSAVPPGAITLDIPAKALLGGVRSVISIRRYQGVLTDPGRLAADLEAWARSYAIRAGCPRHDSDTWKKLAERMPVMASPAIPREPRRLPRRHHLPPGAVAREYHDRMVRATAQMVHRQGYAAMTVTEIVAAAHASRGDFYDQFLNKQEAYMAVQTTSMQQSIAATSTAFFAAPTWPERIWEGLKALLDRMASAPDFTYAAVIEPNTVGTAALQRLTDTLHSFNIFLEEGYSQTPQGQQLPRVCSDAIAGAIFETVYHYTYNDRIAELPRLLPQLAYIALAPFIGPEQARELIEAKSQPPGRSTAPRSIPHR